MIGRLNFGSYFKESDELTPSEDASSRVAGVVDHNGFRVLIDQILEFEFVDSCFIAGINVIGAILKSNRSTSSNSQL